MTDIIAEANQKALEIIQKPTTVGRASPRYFTRHARDPSCMPSVTWERCWLYERGDGRPDLRRLAQTLRKPPSWLLRVRSVSTPATTTTR